MRLYLAGPMRGRPEFNFPVFKKVANELRSVGYSVFCPAELDEALGFRPDGMAGTDAELADSGFDLGAAMADDLVYICTKADAVALLEGLDASLESKGTAAEIAVALALGIPVKYYWEFL
jgi:nucleoside 2-deoxyribosyltransferase